MERTEQPGDGFTVDYLTDGTIVVTYDNLRRPLSDGPGRGRPGRFETVLKGQWSLS